MAINMTLPDGIDSLRVKNIEFTSAAEINMIIGCGVGRIGFMENGSGFL
jgi:hypothetical protein